MWVVAREVAITFLLGHEVDSSIGLSERKEAQVKKLVIGSAFVAAGVYAVRRFGPSLGGFAMKHCEQMFEQMPDDFPPKRMMRGIEEIREQNTRILQQLEKQEHRRTAVAAD
jgi:hypothetical protein